MFNRNIFFLAQIYSIAFTGHAHPWNHVDHPDTPYPTLLQEENEQSSHFCHITDPPGGTLVVLTEYSASGRVTSSQQQLINSPPPPGLFSGHGGSVAATMFNRNIFFLAQVSRLPEAKPFRSDDVCLLLLPCPAGVKRALSSLGFRAFVNLLLRCGDVEQNPGPDSVSSDNEGQLHCTLTDRELILHVLNSQKEIMKQMNTFGDAQKALTDSFAQFNDRLDSLEVSVARLAGFGDKIQSLESTVTKVQNDVTFVLDKIDDLENRSRRNNIIIHGLKEEQNESLESLHENVVNTFFKETLKISVSGVERCHRLGVKKQNKIRPVILKLVDFREKLLIFKNCPKLKNTDMYITEDFSQNVREVRKKLWESTSENRKRKEDVKLVFDKVSVNGTMYVWDKEKNDKVPLRKRSAI
ncbi:uncharacterized protein LOC144165304 [Haemaphysalis longicornis]